MPQAIWKRPVSRIRCGVELHGKHACHSVQRVCVSAKKRGKGFKTGNPRRAAFRLLDSELVRVLIRMLVGITSVHRVESSNEAGAHMVLIWRSYGAHKVLIWRSYIHLTVY